MMAYSFWWKPWTAFLTRWKTSDYVDYQFHKIDHLECKIFVQDSIKIGKKFEVIGFEVKGDIQKYTL